MKIYVVTLIKDIRFDVEGFLSVPHEYEFENKIEAWCLYNQAKNAGYNAMISVRGEQPSLALRKEF